MDDSSVHNVHDAKKAHIAGIVVDKGANSMVQISPDSQHKARTRVHFANKPTYIRKVILGNIPYELTKRLAFMG